MFEDRHICNKKSGHMNQHRMVEIGETYQLVRSMKIKRENSTNFVSRLYLAGIRDDRGGAGSNMNIIFFVSIFLLMLRRDD